MKNFVPEQSESVRSSTQAAFLLAHIESTKEEVAAVSQNDKISHKKGRGDVSDQFFEMRTSVTETSATPYQGRYDRDITSKKGKGRDGGGKQFEVK